MRIDRGLFHWGIFLIALGGVPLAVQQGWADASIAGDLWRLWPLILVGIGLGLILRWTPIDWLGGALVAGTFGIIFGALVAGGISGISSACVGIGSGESSTVRDGPASDVSFGLDVELSCGELGVARGVGATWTVEASHAADNAPTVEGSTARLLVSQGFSGDELFTFAQETRNEWRVGLPETAALTIGMTLNAADAEVDLGPGQLDAIQGTFNASDVTFDLRDVTTAEAARIGMTYNASSGTITLPAASLGGSITLNASSLELCAPPAAAIRIVHDATLSSDDLEEAGLVEGPSGWQTPDFETAVTRIDLRVSSTVSSISLEREEACP